MRDIFLMDGFTEEDIDEVADLFDVHQGGNLSYDEFAAIMDQHVSRPHERAGHRVTEVDCALQALRKSVEMRFNSFRDAFRAMDKNRRSVLTEAEFREGMHSHGIRLAPDSLEELRRHFDHEGVGEISFSRFSRVLSQVPETGKIARQTYVK